MKILYEKDIWLVINLINFHDEFFGKSYTFYHLILDSLDLNKLTCLFAEYWIIDKIWSKDKRLVYSKLDKYKHFSNEDVYTIYFTTLKDFHILLPSIFSTFVIRDARSPIYRNFPRIIRTRV